MTITAPKRSEKNLVGRDDEGRQAQSSCDKLGGQSTYDKLGGQISATNSVAGWVYTISAAPSCSTLP